jgi:hypothetical protein
MSKTRINISLDRDLADFAKEFAAENRLSVADLVTQYFLFLKRGAQGNAAPSLLAHPAFGRALEEARTRLRDGTARWHSYDEVFDD